MKAKMKIRHCLRCNWDYVLVAGTKTHTCPEVKYVDPTQNRAKGQKAARKVKP